MKIDRSIVLSANNVEVDNGIIYLPLYMASLIEVKEHTQPSPERAA